MKSNKGLNLASGVCVPYIFLLFMTKSGIVRGNGFGDSANKPHFLCLGCSGRPRVSCGSSGGPPLGFCSVPFIFEDLNKASEKQYANVFSVTVLHHKLCLT